MLWLVHYLSLNTPRGVGYNSVRRIRESVRMKRLLGARSLLLAMLFTSVSNAQAPRVPVYIQAPPGLDGALSSFIAKRNADIQVVSERARAAYVLSVSPLEFTTSIALGTKDVRSSVMLTERESNQAVWVYHVWLATEGRRNERAVADKIATRLNEFTRKNGGLLVGNARLPQPHGLATMVSKSIEEVFLVPEGFKGHAYVVYGVPDGKPLTENRQQVIYRIPQNGVLRIRDSVLPATDWFKYYYERQDGSLHRIPALSDSHFPVVWPVEADGIGGSIPRSGVFRGPAGCEVQFREFYIDTGSRLLLEHQQEGLGHFTTVQPPLCSK